jgi:hypothetical protein
VADSDAGLFVAVDYLAMDPGWIETRLGKRLGFGSELLSRAVDRVGGFGVTVREVVMRIEMVWWSSTTSPRASR